MPLAKSRMLSDVQQAILRGKRPGANGRHPVLRRSEAASNLAKTAMDSGSEYYREGSRAIASKVKEQPLGSLLVAGAVGFMLALMLNRPRPRRGFRDYYDR
jgi:ElaB/YqjD/DUF883 family membrane-anchored ribosome-binding protein